MKCIICSGQMEPYFTKHFGVYSLGDVEYVRCGSCGFTASQTHFRMAPQEWERLNVAFHDDNNAREDNPWNRNQRYFNQSVMLHLLARNGIVPACGWLDWGSGVGRLSLQLHEHFGIRLDNFDKYMEPGLFQLQQGDLVGRGYSLVTNTAVFEHVRDRETLDEIESYVSAEGCLGVHTLVRREIPADPEWMYLLPVHCAFHTNRSMDVLMRQWGYQCSIYNEHAKMWVMFKRPAKEVSEEVARLNKLLGWECLRFKDGFMDYWT
jgi:hypothetical protein